MLKTTVIIDGKIAKVDTIEWNGSYWLVPSWLDTQDGKWTMPARIIRLDRIPHAPFGAEGFVIHSPMPKELFENRTPKLPIRGYEYQELPEIRLPRRGGN